jgi:N-acetylneuraminate synthase
VNVPRIIAEVGTAHGGDRDHAERLIVAARNAGADTVKFQLVRAAEILHPRSGSVDLPGGKVALFERFRELERDIPFYEDLMQMCATHGMQFLCTPFGLESARILRALGVSELKIASPELNHMPLLQEVASYGLPVLLSTGVSTLADIHEALERIGNHGAAPVSLLHCITAYPAPEEEYNLRVLGALATVTGVPVGVSDHSRDPLLVPVLATLEGAHAIEKHITINRTDGGLDDPIALEPGEFTRMCDAVAEAANRCDSPEDTERCEEVRAELRTRYGAAHVDQIRGDGVKRLAPSETRNYGFTNRSLHAVCDITAGDRFTPENVAVLRTEKNLTPGMHPRYYELVLDSRAHNAIRAGDGIQWSNVISK